MTCGFIQPSLSKKDVVESSEFRVCLTSRFQVQFSDKSLSPTGNDKITFLFSANKSTSLLPISQVVSGGEIARVMLSFEKLRISGAVKLPTIIFDEIDTGVSGRGRTNGK